MRRRDCLFTLGSASLAAGFLPRQASAQTFPERPVSLVNGYPAGGSTEVSARLVSDGMMRRLGGSRVIVENRPGASGTVAAEWVRRQPADGYTLLLSESSSFAIWPSMHQNGTKYAPLTDFDWIGTVCTAPMVLIVSPDFPAKTVAEAVEVLRSPRSEKLDYGTSGAGSIPHIACEMLRHAIGSGNASRHVPYRGGAASVLAVSKGEVGWAVASLGSAAGLIQGGLVRPLAVTSPKRFPTIPDVPTFVEAGLPTMELDIYYLVQAPAGLPPAILKMLNEACAATLADQTARERFVTAGMAAWEGPNTPDSTRAIVERELKRFKEIGERTGIQIMG
ncbi:Bug family tripartite tricarboxylate transporter substrate binding protein [Enterovirga rhinocerotis]|uniref:Tripartite-type tricarboxylate transporter receptor subunit TctC n=1 Tax=Enterovirga rhinocerotis TaxID=1339210 RepID=A0A4R7BS40_9HYPH|nr:tripartite tricarboxylate transporter substrate binding protein [Enterovirga rhinocerotis]TDR88073.1 tripartite-type tricarboxylate transporter receptor subunit TctC [Enterovirga rhinocerotis]